MGVGVMMGLQARYSPRIPRSPPRLRRSPARERCAWIDTWNDNPRPFRWTKTADEILKSLADYLAKINPTTTTTRQ
ncbi:hypothetical protein CQZ88_04650 [Rhodococcus sp. ENV425]|nr:hypothetical protein CQZ88_04650 [Rhodococcus sp. ENV425]